jgi:predicted AAA+ superfamily ATPase
MTRRHTGRPRISNKAIVAIGMRRSGKTTWLHQCQQSYRQEGVAPENLIFFNFEDERLQNFPASQLQLIIDTQNRLYPYRGKETLRHSNEQCEGYWRLPPSTLTPRCCC